jgi:hypothetical protein
MALHTKLGFGFLQDIPRCAKPSVIATSHPNWQERPQAVVALKDGTKATPENLRQFLSAKVRQGAA